MDITKEELGGLLVDYYANEPQMAQLEAQLEQTAETLIALGTAIKNTPLAIVVEQEKLVLRNNNPNGNTIPLATLDIRQICSTILELQQAKTLETTIRRDLTQARLNRPACALEQQPPPTPDILREHRP